MRYALGVAALLALLAAIEGRSALRYDGRFASASLFGLIGIAGFNLFVWVGLGFTLPEHASIIMALQTPMTVLAVWVARGQRPAAFTLGCVAGALVGVLLVVTRGEPLAALTDLASGSGLLGDLLVFCGAVLWVVYTMAVARFPGWSPLRYTVLTCIPGFVGLLAANAVAIAVGAAALPGWSDLAGVAWQIVYFSLGTVVLGVLAFNAATRTLGPLNTMLILNFVPVGVFGIEAALGRSFGAAELTGAGIVIAALVANNLFLRQRRNSAISI